MVATSRSDGFMLNQSTLSEVLSHGKITSTTDNQHYPRWAVGGFRIQRNRSGDASNSLAVADNGNNRVLWFLDPAHTDTKADAVIGQAGNFASTTCNTGGISASSLCEPTGLAMDSATILYVTDWRNNRSLRYL